MSTLAQALEGSAIARRASAASIAVVLAAGLVSAGLKPDERSQPRPAPPTSVVAPRPAATASQATPVTGRTTTIPTPVTTTTTAPRVTPPFQAVPDDPSANVPPPVRGIDPISGD